MKRLRIAKDLNKFVSKPTTIFHILHLRPRIPASLTTAMAPPIPGTDPEQPSQTVGWKLNHICFRIRDPVATTRFYRDILGMRTLFTVNAGSFSILYFGYPEVVGQHETGIELMKKRHNREGLIEFIYIHVTPLLEE